MTELQLLQRRIAQLETENQRLQAENQQLKADGLTAEQLLQSLSDANRELREELDQKAHELQVLINRFYGPKSERFTEDPQQLTFEFGEQAPGEGSRNDCLQAQVDPETRVGGYTRRKRKPRREKLPEHLPREIVNIDLAPEQKHGLVCIGYDSTETLILSPNTLRVRETRYLKYADPTDASAGVQQAEREPGLVEGNRYDTSVAAQIVTAKYGYHLPVYRQQDIFAGSGWIPARSTLLNILTSVAELIRPLTADFADQVRRDSVIGTDDTSVTLLLPKQIPDVDPLDPKSLRVHDVISEALEQGRPSIRAKMWAYRGVHTPLNVFDFTVSRHRDGPDLFLIDQGYEGTLLGDCYGANVGITMRSCGSIVHAACVSHGRRHVREAQHNHSKHAQWLLAMFRELYDIEDRARPLDDAARRELRQAESAPRWDSIRDYIETRMKNVLPKEAMGQAIGYLNNQWQALTRHLTDGAIPIDNNETEQLMKQIAVGRKNWLFIGSVAAGYRAADLMTLVSSAIRNSVDVWAYVDSVLNALLAGCDDFASLRPDVWVAAHPEYRREYRIAEQQDRAQRKQAERERRRGLQLNGVR